MKCSTCGAFVPDDSVFCLECGARVSDTDKTNASDYKTTDISSAGAPTERVSGIPSEPETAAQPFGIPPASAESPPQNSPETAPQPFGIPPASNSSGSTPPAFSVPEVSQTPQPYTPPPPPPANMAPSYGAPTYTTTAVPNSNMAIASLISGILTWVFLPFIGAIVAVITGHMARKEIREANGQLSGEGMALVGLILGYAQLAATALGICAFVGFIFLAVIAGA
ncbi:MAG: DUF4190 domain-containing protein [Chloroflexota bacterium]